VEVPSQDPLDEFAEIHPSHHEVTLLVGTRRAVGRVDATEPAG
jgi:hypothetical protein